MVSATPLPTADHGVTLDLTYAEPLQASARAWTLDVYSPAEPDGSAAVVILTGASATKETASFQALARDIADQGAVVFLANTRTGDARSLFRINNGTPLREAFEGASCAVRFARANAATYDGSSDEVVLLGQSAGGALGLWVALVGDDDERVWNEFVSNRGGPEGQLTCVADASAELDAFVGYAGGYAIFDLVRAEDEELAALFSVETYIGRDTHVLIRLLFPTRETLIPPSLQERHVMMFEALVAAGYDAISSAPEAGHCLDAKSHGSMLEAVVDVQRALE